MLTIKDLTLHYGQSKILNGLTINAETGKVTCVMGTNGVGKTSLLKAISGVHHRTSGEMTIGGVTIGKPPPHALAAKGVGYVPQGRDIFPLLTVRENLETGFACLPPGERRVRDDIFDLFPVLKDMLGRRGGDLSGGQQQQLSIARALVTKPRLLLMDEPTEGIQPNIIQQIGRVIGHLREQGEMAIVLVEQYFDFAYDLADQFYVLKRGQIAASGDKTSLSKSELLEGMAV